MKGHMMSGIETKDREDVSFAASRRDAKGENRRRDINNDRTQCLAFVTQGRVQLSRWNQLERRIKNKGRVEVQSRARALKAGFPRFDYPE